ncbi:MAG: GNAT family N-acetyltransferase, partial [Thermoplasmata archaeon]
MNLKGYQPWVTLGSGFRCEQSPLLGSHPRLSQETPKIRYTGIAVATMNIEIIPFEPEAATEREWARFHAYRRVRHEETDPKDPIAEDTTTEKLMKRPDPHVKISRFAVVDAAQPSGQIGSLDYYTFREESPSYHANKHLAYVELEVLRSSRRRGVGRTILAEAAKLAKEHGKAVILSSCFEE